MKKAIGAQWHQSAATAAANVNEEINASLSIQLHCQLFATAAFYNRIFVLRQSQFSDAIHKNRSLQSKIALIHSHQQQNQRLNYVHRHALLQVKYAIFVTIILLYDILFIAKHK